MLMEQKSICISNKTMRTMVKSRYLINSGGEMYVLYVTSPTDNIPYRIYIYFIYV